MANEIWDPAYIDWLMNEPQYEGNPSYDKDLLKEQGAWLTQASKGGNLTTDLDYLLSSGLLEPAAFEPLTSYEPVETPGARRMAQWERGSPYQQYVAEWFRSGRSANELLSDLTKMVATPSGDPKEQAIIADMPRGQFYDEMTGQYKFTDLPNMASVGEELRSFETDLLSDPEHIIGPDGLPVRVLTEESPAMKKWRAAGFVSDPTAGYDPWSFAPEGTREKEQMLPVTEGIREAELLSRMALLKAAHKEARSAPSALQRFLDMQRESGSTFIPQGRGAGVGSPVARFMAEGDLGPGRNDNPTSINRNAGGAMPNSRSAAPVGSGSPIGSFMTGRDRDSGVPRNVGGRRINPGLGGGGAAPSKTLAEMWLPSSGQLANRVETGVRRGLERRVGAAAEKGRAAQKELDKARRAREAAGDAAFLAARSQAMRQAMADQLLAMGRSPARDEVNRRNAAAYGLGR